MNDTTFGRIKEQIDLRDYAETHLERARSGHKWICPSCKSGGSGKANSDSGFSITADGQHFNCFSCGIKGDIFDLCGIVEGIDGKREQLEAVTNWANIAIDPENGKSSPTGKAEREPDYSQGRGKHRQYIKDAQERLRQEIGSGDSEPLDYLVQRGFTMEEIERFGFGFVRTSRADKNGWLNNAGNRVYGGRILIPWRGSDYYHVDRAMSADVSKKKYDYPDKNEVGQRPIENPGALKKEGVFIVEGSLDAYALEVMGHNSMALGGTAYEKTLDYIKAQGYTGMVVLMLDGDKSGRDAQGKAKEYAENLGLRVYSADFTDVTGVKDVCEGFAWSREGTAEKLEEIKKAAMASRKPDKAGDDGQVETSSTPSMGLQDPAAIAADIYGCEGYEEPTPTGIQALDTVTNGGLRAGLTVLGATSSAGKTTLCVQIADYVAAHGKPVLFCTIEQSGRELVSKSLSRLMARRGYKSVPAWAMNSPKERDRWTEAKAAAFVEVVEEYTREIAPNLVYQSANEQPTVAQVVQAARIVEEAHGQAPVVIVDYLQLLAPKDERDTDKRAADYNVSALRRMARDMKTPIIAISSLNRTSYSGSIEMESFKESGGIEYGADVLLGLQPYNMEERMKSAKGEEARKKRAKDITNEFRRKAVRECEIVVLKNRNGALPQEPLPVTFDCASSLFSDDASELALFGGEEMPVI